MAFPITPEMVKEAYAETGLAAVHGQWFLRATGTDAHCACGLSVVIACREGIERAADVQRIQESDSGRLAAVAVAKTLQLTPNQVKGFVRGFDGEPNDSDAPEAFAAGRKSAQLMGLIDPD